MRRTTIAWIVGAAAIAAVVIAVLAGGDDPPAPANTEPEEPEVEPQPDLGPTLAPAGQFIESVDPLPTGVLRFVTSAPEGQSRFCAIGFEEGTGEPLARALCVPVDAGGRVPPLADDVFGMLSRDRALFDLRGTAVARDAHDSAIADPSGRVTSIIPTDSGGAIEIRRGAEVFRRPIEARQALLLPGGQVVFANSNDILFSVATDRDDAEIVQIGAVPEGTDAIRACITGSELVAITHGKLSRGERSIGVTFFDGTSWSPIVVGRSTLTEYKLTCREGIATLTWPEVVDNAGVLIYQIHQTTCTREGCNLVSSNAQIAGSDPVAVDLAGKVLLVWASDTGTRARLAAMTELDGGMSITSFEPPGTRVLARRVEVRRSIAIVLIRTDRGIIAFRIDPQGAVRQLDVRELNEPP